MKRQNVCIKTFHFADNYGAVLQCYALQKYIEGKGINVCVSNDIPRRMIPYRVRLKRLFVENEQQRKFRFFREKYLNLKNIKNVGTLIVGSDQVWNPDLNKFDKTWFGSNISYDRIISYAASIGKEHLTKRDEKYFKENIKFLKAFSRIYVREASAKEILNAIGIESETVCDPVFLNIRNLKVYEEIASTSKIIPKEKYALVYSLEKNEDIDNVIEKIKKSEQLDIYGIHPVNSNLQKVDKFIYNAGPEDFLGLILNCEYVITNSFHGLVFGLIFNKRIICVNHSSYSSRQTEILNILQKKKIYNENVIFIEQSEKNQESIWKYVDDSTVKLDQVIYSQN